MFAKKQTVGRAARNLAAALVVVGVMSSAAPAFAAADGNQAATGTQAMAPDVVTPQSNPDCKGQWVFDNTSVKTDRIGRVGSPVSNYYGSGGTMALSTGYSGTVGASVSVGVSAEASAAMFAKVQVGLPR